MERENKIILSAILILVVAVVSFKFVDVTGAGVRNLSTTISVDPKQVTSGDVIKITVNPGSAGCERDILFYDSGGDRYNIAGAAKVCGNYKCTKDNTEPILYRISDAWATGRYYARVQDYKTEGYAEVGFDVISQYPPKGPELHR